MTFNQVEKYIFRFPGATFVRKSLTYKIIKKFFKVHICLLSAFWRKNFTKKRNKSYSICTF